MRPRILLVDDRPENLTALEAILAPTGWELHFARSGAEALRALLSGSFAVVVTDMHMPGMDGAEVARAVRSRAASRHTAILMLTASSGEQEQIARAYASGAADFITKPVTAEVLLAKLRVFVELYEKTEQIREQAERLREAERLERAVEMERVRRAGERRYQILADVIPQIVWTADTDGRIVWWNERWFAYTGQPSRSRDGRLEAIHPEDRRRYLAAWEGCLATGATLQIDVRLRRHDGQFRWFLSRALPELSEEEVVGWTGTDTDIDDARRAAGEREELLQREREARERAEHAVKLREEFLQVAAHELRTPLTSLNLALAQLERSGEPDEAHGRRLGLAKRQVKRLRGLVETLLDVSRIGEETLPLRRTPVDLARVAQEVIDRFADELSRQSCPVNVSLSSAPCLGDPDRLDQVISNLVGNALKYGPGFPVEISVARQDGTVVLEVRDHGIGISSGDLERIFERFGRAVPTTSYGGLGLGLFLSRKIVHAHGGTLTVTSVPDQSTTFRMELPAQVEQSVTAGRGH